MSPKSSKNKLQTAWNCLQLGF